MMRVAILVVPRTTNLSKLDPYDGLHCVLTITMNDLDNAQLEFVPSVTTLGQKRRYLQDPS